MTEKDRKNLTYMSMYKLLSGFASYLYDIGIVIYLFDETESVAAVGGFFVAQLLPAILILLSGGIIDRYNKKKVAITCCLMKAALFMLLGCNRNIWFIYIVTFFFNFLIEFESSIHQALMASVFEKKQIVAAASRINFWDSAAMVIAPACASFLASYVEFQVNLILGALLLVGTALILNFLEMSVIEKNITEKIFKANVYVTWIKDKKIWISILFWTVFMFCIGITAPLEISMIEDVLSMPAAYYGLGYTIEGIGMLAASCMVLRTVEWLKPKRIILIGLISSAFSYLIIGLSGNIWIYFVGAVFVGMTAVFCPLGFKTELQLVTPEALVGRTFSAARFVVLLSRIAGTVLVGMILQSIEIRKIYFGVAVVLAATTILYKMWIQNLSENV